MLALRGAVHYDSVMRNETTTSGKGGVQSLDRAFAILEAMADAGGVVALSRLADDTDLPLPTIHRIVRTLVELGYVRQQQNRLYSLGPRLIRLGETTSRMLGPGARRHMARVVDELGESVNLAILDGDEIVYVGQVQPQTNSMRMFTEVGARALPHCTAVGKAILASSSEEEVRSLVARTGMPRRTTHTLTTPEALLGELERTRERGYALDEQEQELGVRCVAVAVPGAPREMAVSMSGPLTRMGDDVVAKAAPLLRGAAAEIGAELRVS